VEDVGDVAAGWLAAGWRIRRRRRQLRLRLPLRATEELGVVTSAARRQRQKTRGGWGVSLPPQPDGYWSVFSGLPGRNRPAKRPTRVFPCLQIGPGIYTTKPAETLAPNEALRVVVCNIPDFFKFWKIKKKIKISACNCLT
jgi:hypothetical protein